jgi:hypothetical protein
MWLVLVAMPFLSSLAICSFFHGLIHTIMITCHCRPHVLCATSIRRDAQRLAWEGGEGGGGGREEISYGGLKNKNSLLGQNLSK